MIRVTIYNEYVHECLEPQIREIYPNGIHKAIADFLACDDISVRTVTLFGENALTFESRLPGQTTQELLANTPVTLDEALSEEVLNDTDVLIWWGHMAHGFVPDSVVARCQKHIQCGMGAVFLHSAHHSKLFKAMMGTPCGLCWGANVKERLWNLAPDHPILQGIGKFVDLPAEEMYGEPFQIPEPERLLMIGTYETHEVFRSLCTYRRYNGKIVYFQPGHEENPTYYIPEIQTIIRNAVRWVAPTIRLDKIECPRTDAYPL